ncbi:hypothetical protein ACH4U5_09455 [Streptomyces sp. NPDC020858]|uniref:hypothetical protein n=1 Tax=Streptomyces sp. NPDC020858 TaxID=3365097 RepID=UPI0037AF0BBC
MSGDTTFAVAAAVIETKQAGETGNACIRAPERMGARISAGTGPSVCWSGH